MRAGRSNQMDYKKLTEEMANGIEAEIMKLIKNYKETERKGAIKKLTHLSENGRRMLTFSFAEDSLYVSHSFWTRNKKAIIGDMLFKLTSEQALITANKIIETYNKVDNKEENHELWTV
jgi:uncharacterized protein YjgD (DUF1641 family)